jgi:alanine racemase
LDHPIVWAEINLEAIAHNVRELRRITKPDARLMAVVKANGYGHGAVEVALTALENGAEILGAARIDEGIGLRKAGFDVPILIFGYTPPELAHQLLEFDLTQTVYSYQTAKALSRAAASYGRDIKVHLKMDTGMGRLGMLPARGQRPFSETAVFDEIVREVEAITRLPALEVEGVYTHFATADSSDKSYAKLQIERFMEILNQLRLAGLEPPVKHAANSAALIDMPETHLDMVRPGISIYGLYPSNEVNKSRVLLKPAMTLKARIIQLKKVPAGFKVSYGITFQTEKSTTIATVPVGYADGYDRLMSSRGYMLVHGLRAPVVGRVCMDLTMLDVGEIPEAGLEDEVVVFGSQGNASIPVDEIASSLNTINYEIVSTVMERVPRIYSR